MSDSRSSRWIWARPSRFAAVGGLSGLIQLSLLALLTDAGWNGILANPVAFLLAAQFNFWLSDRFTWGDRRSSTAAQAILARWARFHVSITGTALLNMAVFTVARSVMADLLASATGIAVAALTNFLLGDRFVFRQASTGTGLPLTLLPLFGCLLAVRKPARAPPGGNHLHKISR